MIVSVCLCGDYQTDHIADKADCRICGPDTRFGDPNHSGPPPCREFRYWKEEEADKEKRLNDLTLSLRIGSMNTVYEREELADLIDGLMRDRDQWRQAGEAAVNRCREDHGQHFLLVGGRVGVPYREQPVCEATITALRAERDQYKASFETKVACDKKNAEYFDRVVAENADLRARLEQQERRIKELEG